jgi:hypothetical protein
MTPTELAGLIEGAKELREDYARRIREIDEEIAKMTANYRRMVNPQRPIIEVL